MKKVFFRRLLAGFLVLLLLVLTACQNTGSSDGTGSTDPSDTTEEVTESDTSTPDGLVLVQDGTTPYKIIYPESAGEQIMGAVISLADAFEELYGVEIKIGDDYLKSSETEDEDAFEIVIGKTNRSATEQVRATLEDGNYTACAVNNRLVLVGSSEMGTLAAVEELISRLFTAEGTELVFTDEDSFLLYSEERIKISFLGDSITTYNGYSNNADYNSTLTENPVWYVQSRLRASATWWYGVVQEMGWELCVNNSYSGGRVSNAYSQETMAVNLHTDEGVVPDVIVIYYGINDYNNKVELSAFTQAYDTMLKNMKEAYPNATIYCCTLNPIICTDNGRNTSLEMNGAGVTITAFNNAILRTADANGVHFIDFYTEIGDQVYQHTYDQIHPNEEGMALMRDVVTATLKDDFT